MTFSPLEQQRYSRHFSLDEVGITGQKLLKQSRVLVVGLGGLGSAALPYLVASGIGTIGIIDFDLVDLSNLQRQVIYRESDLGQPKVVVAENNIKSLNSTVELIGYNQRLSTDNIKPLFEKYDYIVDGSDNFATRYLINDASVLYKNTVIHGSVSKFEGQLMIIKGGTSACLRCLYPNPPPPGLFQNCQEEGVLGVLPGVIGLLQATELIKLIVNIGEDPTNRLIKYDALNLSLTKYTVLRDEACPVCSSQTELLNLTEEVMMTCNLSEDVKTIDEKLKNGQVHLLDVREASELRIVNIGGIEIPLHQLESRLEELPHDKPIAVICHHGMRSNYACQLLRTQGFDAINVTGGIDAWARFVDTDLQRY